MKIFTDSKYRDSVNFVDEDNIVLGYSLDQDCCEHAGWYVSDDAVPTEEGVKSELHDIPNEWQWRFDPEFFAENSLSCLDSGSVATFRIVNRFSNEQKFIHLFNIHNGYYGHGFHFSKPFREGTL